MSATALPEYCDPQQLADKTATLRGRASIARMPRLQAALAPCENQAEVELHFGRDAGGRRLLTGKARVQVALVCRRCLGNALHDLDVEFRLAIVASEAEADRLPDEYDALISDGRLRTLDLVEDELILALPLVPMHREADCKPQAELGEAPEGPGAQRDNPFAALAKLKNRNDRD